MSPQNSRSTMACVTCGRPLPANARRCEACGTPVTISARRQFAALKLWHLAVPVVIAIVSFMPEALHWLGLRLPLRTTPIVREAAGRIAEDPQVTSLLGEPVRAGWAVTGYIRTDETGWSEGRFWIPVHGPKGSGTAYARVGRGTGPWVFTTLECQCGSTPIDLLNPPPIALPRDRDARVFLVPLGRTQDVRLDALADYYASRLGLQVSILDPVAVDVRAYDDARNQFIGEQVIASMKRTLSAVPEDATVIGILEDDMYVASLRWRFAFNYRDSGRFAVVATGRMVPALNWLWPRNELLQTRVRKMVTKDIGMLAFGLPSNGDPTSLLYNGIGGLDDLDLVEERFDGLGHLAEINPIVVSHRDAPIAPEIRADARPADSGPGTYPCFVVRPGVAWDGVEPIDARVLDCSPGLRVDRKYDEFEVDLRNGALISRRTDLMIDDATPLVLTRCFRSWDTISRSFGAGSTHPYDILPTGTRNPYTYVDLWMPDAGQIHYDRISQGTGYADALYEHTATNTPFRGSRLSWNGNGWDLRFADGGLFRFPENYAGTKPHHGAPTEMRDASGNVIALRRDADRNLEMIAGPGGRFIKLSHDAQSRVTEAVDDSGRRVSYAYDAGGRLAAADGAEDKLRYRYQDVLLTSVENNGRSILSARYAGQQLSELTLADGRTFRFTVPVGSRLRESAPETIVEAPDHTQTRVPVRLDR